MTCSVVRLAVLAFALVALAALTGCSGRRLPPGTPPPEYEPPSVTPWPLEQPDAAATQGPTLDASSAPESAPSTQLSQDADVR